MIIPYKKIPAMINLVTLLINPMLLKIQKNTTAGEVDFTFLNAKGQQSICIMMGGQVTMYTLLNNYRKTPHRIQKFYINGNEVARTANSNAINYSGLGTNTRIGIAYADFHGSIDDWWNGGLDSLEVFYNKRLSNKFW